MIDKERIKRVTDERDPNRCQAGSQAHGQCLNVAEVGSKYCLAHGGDTATTEAKEKNLRNYRLTKFHTRAAEMRESSGIKDLRDEIAILRMTLEEKMNAFENASEMILQSGAISELILKIEKLVTSCHKLEKDMGVTIEKTTVIRMAEQIVGIINKYVTDKETIENIVREMQVALTERKES
ncbi:MAG TPA: hypothetical protein PLE74_00925 [Candidatus Cloacimonadota bacterium]|nr:hypothetical protein [Candidatus Cloacimonadota bacterium]